DWIFEPPWITGSSGEIMRRDALAITSDTSMTRAARLTQEHNGGVMAVFAARTARRLRSARRSLGAPRGPHAGLALAPALPDISPTTAAARASATRFGAEGSEYTAMSVSGHGPRGRFDRRDIPEERDPGRPPGAWRPPRAYFRAHSAPVR